MPLVVEWSRRVVGADGPAHSRGSEALISVEGLGRCAVFSEEDILILLELQRREQEILKYLSRTATEVLPA